MFPPDVVQRISPVARIQVRRLCTAFHPGNQLTPLAKANGLVRRKQTAYQHPQKSRRPVSLRIPGIFPSGPLLGLASPKRAGRQRGAFCGRQISSCFHMITPNTQALPGFQNSMHRSFFHNHLVSCCEPINPGDRPISCRAEKGNQLHPRGIPGGGTLLLQV
jgi:hypothetical protein